MADWEIFLIFADRNIYVNILDTDPLPAIEGLLDAFSAFDTHSALSGLDFSRLAVMPLVQAAPAMVNTDSVWPRLWRSVWLWWRFLFQAL